MPGDESGDALRLSIVIPAHDESAHIGRLLVGLAPLADFTEVFVIANGCTDDTAEQARQAGSWVTVLESDIGSKPLALDAGDAAATAFPRLYLDADVVVDDDDVLALAAAIGDPSPIAVAATPSHDLSASSWAVRSHYRIWTKMTTNSQGLGGANPQMLSKQARSRFETWPDVIGDDYFLDGLFSDDEARRVPTVSAVRVAPAGMLDCMSRKARIHAGNVAVASRGLRAGHVGGGAHETIRVVRADPARVVDLPAHLFITIGSRLIYRWRRWRGRDDVFFRDRSRAG